MNTLCPIRLLACLVLPCIACVSPVLADPGEPVAIRHLPDGGFVIESMWNLSVVITADPSGPASDLQGVDILLAGPVSDSQRPPHRFVEWIGGQGTVEFDKLLDRAVNEPKAVWRATTEVPEPSGNAIRVRSLAPSSIILIEVDGVRIAYIPDAKKTIEQQPDDALAETDVLVFGPENVSDDHQQAIQQLRRESAARLVVLADALSDDPVESNTVAVCIEPSKPESVRTVVLSEKAIELPSELETLIKRKEAACQASQKVFAALSINQMNFVPSNGTHTPRWNAEHMMGRELMFFSQIFSKQDASIPVMNLNPKQMPPEYVARHPDWTGEEEARQMERVSAFTRRFAYLMKDLPLDSKAAGSSWTPRALLEQMERHYNEHTANVKKKSELDDWPVE